MTCYREWVVLKPVVKASYVAAAAADIGARAVPGGRCVLMPDEEAALIAGWRELGAALFAGWVTVLEGITTSCMNKAVI